MVQRMSNPVRVLRVGRKLRVPTALLADVLGLGMEEVLERIDTSAALRDRVAMVESELAAAPTSAP